MNKSKQAVITIFSFFFSIVSVSDTYSLCYDHVNEYLSPDSAYQWGVPTPPVAFDGKGFIWDPGNSLNDDNILETWICDIAFTDARHVIGTYYYAVFGHDSASLNGSCSGCDPSITAKGGFCVDLGIQIYANSGTPTTDVYALAQSDATCSADEVSDGDYTDYLDGLAWAWGQCKMEHRNDPNNYSQWQYKKDITGLGTENIVDDQLSSWTNTSYTTFTRDLTGAIHFDKQQTYVSLSLPHVVSRIYLHNLVENEGYSIVYAYAICRVRICIKIT